jgi:hypothetical protein
MAKRKAISKKVRFEIFKRDGFICQYCGAHPPSVILNVDHIHPVALGGDNSDDNLVTSCQSCNLGKGAAELTNAPQSLQDKAAMILEREAQINGYQRVMNDKKQRLLEESVEVCDVYELFHEGYTLNDKSLISVRKFIEELGVHEVLSAMETACSNQKIKGGKFPYFCGICWNKIKGSK